MKGIKQHFLFYNSANVLRSLTFDGIVHSKRNLNRISKVSLSEVDKVINVLIANDMADKHKLKHTTAKEITLKPKGIVFIKEIVNLMDEIERIRK